MCPFGKGSALPSSGDSDHTPEGDSVGKDG